ncbi:DUF1570 domain-containing protein [Rhodocytophaga rosea]|uniref:DUF1570 domain-containing protein n=1 Tax=Rhodocytophaga rosea TaxID=2704465 RepID=A0A6C0GRJ0_9BACT|nr:DUF1570 domain-containing protein [Rhodocytophaga rosea]QHT70484.1 DUF1570 domain-containing protein [Rhodocytophaga rosea]
MFAYHLFRKRFLLLFFILTVLCFLKTSSAHISQPVVTHSIPSGSIFQTVAVTTPDKPAIEIIYQDCASDKQTHERMLKGINFLYEYYQTQFGYDFTPELVVKIRVFENFDGYKKYIRKASPSTTGSNVGLYIHKLHEAIVWKNKNEDMFLSTVFHETNHLLLRSNIDNCPKWINEGLSEYFEFLDVTGEEVQIRPQLVKDDKIKKWVASQKMPDMYGYLTKYNEDWDKENNISDEPRVLAWSMVYFLMSERNGQAFIKDCLDYFSKKHADKYATVRALDAYYPGKHAQFEKNWLTWIPEQRSNHVLIINPPAQESRVQKFFKRVRQILS